MSADELIPVSSHLRSSLLHGLVIPAHPLALNSRRLLDERRQRALTRYYIEAGAGGLAVGVHTTQFHIRDKHVGLFQPVLALAAEEMDRADAGRTGKLVRIGGIVGRTPQACEEASTLRRLGYHAGLVSLAALPDATDDDLIAHCCAIARIIPLVGFYLQPKVGGRPLAYAFWRRFAEIPSVAAIKIAPFDRYATLDVVRAVVDAGRDDIALYTGNDDSIVHDLLSTYRLHVRGQWVNRRIVGGLLGHWSVWTRRAVELLDRCRAAAGDPTIPTELLTLAAQVTDTNAAFFDAANAFRGVIAGLHEVLRRQGLLEGIWCLDEHESLGPGQREEIDRVLTSYPHLNDDDFVAANRDRWLSG